MIGTLLALSGLAAGLPSPMPSETVVIARADEAAAWIPFGGSDPVAAIRETTPGGSPALLFPCRMARLAERAGWDRAAEVDLSGCGGISFWARGDGDPSSVAGSTLYFAAGAGWYAAPFDVPFGEWGQVEIERSSFTAEGSPAGWSAVRGARISFWKGRWPGP